jgi:hypothetical protein
LILPHSDPTKCTASYGGTRNLAYNLRYLPSDNHMMIDLYGLMNKDGRAYKIFSDFSRDDYITVGYYAYTGSYYYLQLTKTDNTKYYYNANRTFHAPSVPGNLQISYASHNQKLRLSWQADQEQKKLRYELNYHKPDGMTYALPLEMSQLTESDNTFYYELAASALPEYVVGEVNEYHFTIRGINNMNLMSAFSEETTILIPVF